VRALLPALLLGSTLMIGAAPAEAMTGGASPYPSGSASESTLAEDAFVFSAMRSAGATWYGPGLYGRHTACGQTLRPATIGVAHKTLPCGTAVKFLYRGRSVVARVIDRGPYSVGNSWDLTNGARLALGFEGANRVRYAIGRPAAG
jgi:rare lipoprotein A (peptidoglycan hydrolase)